MSEQRGKEAAGLDRRHFLGAGVAVTVGAIGQAAAAPVAAGKTSNDQPYNDRTHKAMPTRNLGKTGFQVGIFSLGGQATIEIPGKERESELIVNRALDLGVNYIDTAAGYGDGTSERHIGQVLKSRRREVFLASKTHRRTYDESMRLLERSLKNLQTDHLDLWQLHNVQSQGDVDQVFAKDGAIHALEKARSQGIVRFLGITGHFEPIVLLEAIKRYPFDALLLAVNAADVHYLSFVRYLLPEAQRRGLATIGMKIATRGRILSCWNPPPPEQQPERMRTPLKGTITMKESLYYNFSLPVSTNIVGVDDVRQLEENVRWASEFSPLCEAEMRELEFRTLPIARQALYFRRWNLPS
jgi:uncharacterized protein